MDKNSVGEKNFEISPSQGVLLMALAQSIADGHVGIGSTCIHCAMAAAKIIQDTAEEIALQVPQTEKNDGQ